MFAKDRVIALDIGASGIVMAEFGVNAGQIELIRYAHEALDVEPDSDADLSAYIVATLRDLVRSHELKPGPVFLSISGQNVFPRYVKLPPVTGDKVVQMVKYEAEQNVPFPIDEVVWDYQLIHGTDDGLNVMLVAVKKDIVKSLTDCIEAAGFDPEIVDSAPMALYNTATFNYPHIDGCIMIMDMGARSSNLVFVEQDLIFSRSIPVAGNTITAEIAKEFDCSFSEAEELKKEHAFVAFGGVYAGPDNETADRISKITRSVMTRLHAEVNRSINFYRSQQGGSKPVLVLLTGGTAIIPHTDTFFREKLQVDVEILNPFNEVSVSEDLETDQIMSDIHLLGEVVGLGLRATESAVLEINLMPKEISDKKVLRRRIPFFVGAAAALVISLVCWWLNFNNMSKTAKAKVEFLDKEISFYKSNKKKIVSNREAEKVYQDRADELSSLAASRDRWPKILSDLYELKLDGMWYYELKPRLGRGEFGKVKSLEVKGMVFTDKVKGNQQLQQFSELLQNKGAYFNDVKVDLSRFVDFTGDFTLIISLSETPKKVKVETVAVDGDGSDTSGEGANDGSDTGQETSGEDPDQQEPLDVNIDADGGGE